LMHDLLDIERGAKVSGARCYFLKNAAALLENAVIRYALDFLAPRGFAPMITPVFVREEAMVGTGYFPTGREEAYAIERDELYLIGTSEVTLVSFHPNEILQASELPIRYAGCTTCFRREAGSYGRDVRGLYRVHQFQKVEQVVICRNDEEEMHRLHAEILNNSEEIVRAFGIPYRVVEVCTGEMGMGQVKKHDIECWMPGRGGYGETHSCSSFGDFQSRRSRIRYKDGGSNVFPFTLNNTAIASPRILIAIMENNQQADGSIVIPEVLVPYMNGRRKIGG
jgi:seryl-tRNA synthetase